MRRRDNDELLQPVVARGTKLSRRRSGSRGRHRFYSRLRTRKNHGNRQLLGRSDPCDFVGVIAGFVGRQFVSSRTRRTDEFPPLHRRAHTGRCHASDRSRSRCGTGVHQESGTNGGGFFNANGAHPFENPTSLTNFVELLAIVVIPAAFTHTFGRMVGRPRDGWVIFWTMTALFIVGLLVCNWAETSTHPALASHVVGGNMEGKEVRFGTGASTLAAVVTSNGATGSYNS